MRDMVEENDMYIKYIRKKENLAKIMMNYCYKADHAKHAKILTEGEIWELVENGREMSRIMESQME